MSKTDNVRRLFRGSNQTPAEEAAAIGSVTNVAATATAAYSARWQQRLAYSIRWLKALQDTAAYAEQAFGQVTEEALLDTMPGNAATIKTVVANLATLYDEPEGGSPFERVDFVTDSDGETEKIADTEPVPPMNREQRRAAAQAGKPVGPPAGPHRTPPKDHASKSMPIQKGQR